MAIATQRPLPAQVADTFRPRGPIVRWLVVLAVAIAALLFGVLWQLAVHRHALALESLAISQATQIDGQLARLSQLPAVVAEDPRLQAVLNTRSAEHIATANALLSRVQQQTNIGQAYLMDRNGLTVAASNHATASSFVGRNYGFRQYFKHALDGNRGTQYAVGATTGEPGYFVSQPVQVARTVLGVLVFKLSLEHVSDIWSARDEHTLLVDDTGIVILSSNPAMLFANTRPITSDQARALRQTRHYPVSSGDTADIEETPGNALWSGQRLLRASAPLNAEDWHVTVLTPRHALLLRVARDFATVLAVLAAVLLLLRDWWRQRLLASTEQHNARVLSRQIAEKSRELEQAQRTLIENSNLTALGRMSSAINHEVNQPLASLRLNLASLRHMTQSADTNAHDMQRALEDCERTTKRISHVVDALRSLSKPGDTRLAKLTAHTVLKETSETFLREQPADMRPTLQVAMGDNPTFDGNAVLLQQALLNLLQNAEKATAMVESPRIEIGSTTTATHIIFYVSDNGPGVGAELADSVFEPFVQGEASTRGLGLGLALARQIAQYHHGELVHERNEQCETRFSLSIPTPREKTA